MIPDAECVKVACEILSELDVGDFVIKVFRSSPYSHGVNERIFYIFKYHVNSLFSA